MAEEKRGIGWPRTLTPCLWPLGVPLYIGPASEVEDPKGIITLAQGAFAMRCAGRMVGWPFDLPDVPLSISVMWTAHVQQDEEKGEPPNHSSPTTMPRFLNRERRVAFFLSDNTLAHKKTVYLLSISLTVSLHKRAMQWRGVCQAPGCSCSLHFLVESQFRPLLFEATDH
eukprot:565940-Rhodomonas_salina.1